MTPARLITFLVCVAASIATFCLILIGEWQLHEGTFPWANIIWLGVPIAIVAVLIYLQIFAKAGHRAPKESNIVRIDGGEDDD